MLQKKRIDEYGDILSPNDVKEILGIGYNKTYELLRNGMIKNFKIGRDRKIPKWCIKEYIETMISNSDCRNT